MAVPVSTWQMTVTLIKLVQRKGSIASAFTDAQRTIDLTPMLGESCTVKTVKNTMSPAGGFTITLTDQAVQSIQDTVYALIEPMDMIEIRASRQPWKSNGQKLPLIMRGYVSDVRRSESMGQDGRPQRIVVVQGLDSGKFWQIHRVLWNYEYATGNDFISTFRMQTVTGIQTAFLPLPDFLNQLMGKFINAKIADFSGAVNRVIPAFTFQGGTIPGRVAYMVVADVEGPAWGYVEKFADRPWNEAFTKDTEAGPVLVAREVPYCGIDGKFIMPNATDPGSFDVTIDQVVATDVVRSDSRVANFFYVPPGFMVADSGGLANASAFVLGQGADIGYGNDTTAIYGEREMQIGTNLQPPSIVTPPTFLQPGGQVQASATLDGWAALKSSQLKALNRDNVVWEEGSLTFQGTELAQHGQYLRLHRGGVLSQAYVPQIAHSFQPLGAWMTTASMIRGTGFLVRDKMSVSPYWAEGRRGPYSVPGAAA